MKRVSSKAWIAIIGGLILSLLTAGVAWAAIDTHSSGKVRKPIEDFERTVARIKVPDQDTIKDVNASVRLNHSSDANLGIFLRSPTGAVETLAFQQGDGANFGKSSNNCDGKFTTFDDEAGTPINAGPPDAKPPFVGSFSPVPGSLSAFDGQQMEGTWKLIVEDFVSGDDGKLGCAVLRIKH